VLEHLTYLVLQLHRFVLGLQVLVIQNNKRNITRRSGHSN